MVAVCLRVHVPVPVPVRSYNKNAHIIKLSVPIDRVKPIYLFIGYRLMGREGSDGLLLSAERTGSPPSTPGFAASIFDKVRFMHFPVTCTSFV